MTPLILFTIKAVYSAILGFLLGVQREKVGRAAGSRTYALVTLGSAIFTTISISAVWNQVQTVTAAIDPTHIAAQIVVGIGFLGAGMIIFHDDKVQGLTTAAGLWVAAAIGMVVGVGLYWEALILTILTFLIFFVGQVQEKSGWLKR